MKIFRFFVKCFLILILLILIFWAVIFAILQTKQGQAWAYEQFISYLEKRTETHIEIEKVQFTFPLHLNLENIAFSQEGEKILDIQKLQISCSSSHLLEGRIIISQLKAFGIHILKIPQLQNTSSSLSDSSFETPFCPFYVKFENIHLENIDAAPSIIETLSLQPQLRKIVDSSSLNLQGMVSSNPFKTSITAHLLLTANHKQVEAPPFSLAIDVQNHQLSFSLHATEFPFLSSFSPYFSSLYKIHLAFCAFAPISTWQNVFHERRKEGQLIDGHFKLSLQTASDESPAFPLLPGETLIISSHYTCSSWKNIELFNFKADHPYFFLEGSPILSSDLDIQGRFKGSIHNLAHFQTWIGKSIQGTLQFEGTLSGSLHSPSIALDASSPSLTIEEQTLHHVRFAVNGDQQNDWNGYAILYADYQDIPVKISSSLNWRKESQQLILSNLEIDAMRAHAVGEFKADLSDFTWQGSMAAHTENLSEISHFFTIPVNGEGQLYLRLDPIENIHHQKQHRLSLHFQGKRLQWADGQASQLFLKGEITPSEENQQILIVHSSLEGEGIHWKEYAVKHCITQSSQSIDPASKTLSNLAIDWKAIGIQWPEGKAAQCIGQVHLNDPFNIQEGNVQFTVKDLRTSMMYLEELQGASRIHPSQKQWPFSLKGKGVWKEDLIFTTEGAWHYEQNIWKLHLSQFNGRFGPYPLQLLQPLHFKYDPHSIQLTGLHFKWGEADIQGGFYQDGQNFSSQVQTNAVPLELFHFIAPNLPFTGLASFQGRVEGPIDHPQGKLQIDVNHIQLIEEVLIQKPLIAGRLSLDFNNQGIQLKSQLNGIGNTPMFISGRLPLTLSLNPLDVKTQNQFPLDLDIKAEGKLDPYLQLFYNDVTNLSGQAKIAFKLSGQMDAPQIKGHIDLFDGTYESLKTGTLYRNIQARLEGAGSKIILKQFTAQDNKQGSINASGELTLDFKKDLSFAFQIHPKQIYILDSDYAAIQATGDLYLNGNFKQAKLEGDLKVDQAMIRLEEALPNQFKTVDVRYINVSQQEPIPSYVEKKEAPSVVELDIKLQAPHVLIEGNHIKSEWKGLINITGTMDHPQLYGDLRIAQGQYDFNGKIFNFSQGHLHFGGAPDKKTTLYVVASKDIDRIRADIIVKGPITKPAISFRSNPPLSQREVLSYILFNRGISDITADQGDELSQSFMSLNSSDQTKSGMDFLSRLRNNIGIDRLDFTTGDKENQDIGLQVGKNITENIFFSVNQSMVSLSPIIAVEAKLRKNIKAQAEAGIGENTPVRMSIKWKKDY